MFSFIKISSTWTHFWNQNTKTFLPSLEPIKYSKPSIPKEALLDTTILLISI